MAESDRNDVEVLFHSPSAKGKGVIRRCADSDELYQIRCIYVDPDWSEPWTLDFIRDHYCYEGARCVIDAAVAGSEPISASASAKEGASG